MKNELPDPVGVESIRCGASNVRHFIFDNRSTAHLDSRLISQWLALFVAGISLVAAGMLIVAQSKRCTTPLIGHIDQAPSNSALQGLDVLDLLEANCKLMLRNGMTEKDVKLAIVVTAEETIFSRLGDFTKAYWVTGDDENCVFATFSRRKGVAALRDWKVIEWSRAQYVTRPKSAPSKPIL